MRYGGQLLCHFRLILPAFFHKRLYSTQIYNPPPWNVLFFGTDDVSLASLSALRTAQLQENLISNLEVICGSHASQASPVKKFALRQGLKVHEISRSSIESWQLPSLSKSFDIGVVVSFGYFIPARIISELKFGGINMHPSLLPRHRGAAPIYHTLLKDDKVGGISVIELHKSKFDAGKLLYQEKISISDDITHKELLPQLAELGAKSVLHVLRNFNEISREAKVQTTEGITQAGKIHSDMGKINWATQTAQEIWILWRALWDTVGIYTHLPYNNSYIRIKLVKLLPPNTPSPSFPADANPGSLVRSGKLLWVKSKDKWVGVDMLQSEGKKVLQAYEWLNGYQIGRPGMPSVFVDT